MLQTSMATAPSLTHYEQLARRFNQQTSQAEQDLRHELIFEAIRLKQTALKVFAGLMLIALTIVMLTPA